MKSCYTPTSLWNTIKEMENPVIVRVVKNTANDIDHVAVEEGKP